MTENSQPSEAADAAPIAEAKVFRVRLVRGSRIRGRSYRVGSVVDVTSALAGKLVQSNKAVLAPDAELHQAPNETPESRMQRYRDSVSRAQTPRKTAKEAKADGGEDRPATSGRT